MALSRRRFLGLSAAALASLAACGRDERLPVEGVPRGMHYLDATAEEVTLGFDLTGKLAVVTGCTSGTSTTVASGLSTSRPAGSCTTSSPTKTASPT